MRHITKNLSILVLLGSMVLGSTRVAYTRPGLMMRIPTSSNQKTPYLFRVGFGTEIHNFDPFNTAKGAYAEMELSKGFSLGFSAVQGGDTTSLALLKESHQKPVVEFGFHFQQRVFSYNDISLTVGLQDVVFQNDQTSDEILSLNTSLLSFFTVLASEKDLGEYKMNTYMGFGSGGLAPMDTIEVDPDSVSTSAGVFLGFVLKTPYFARRGGMDIDLSKPFARVPMLKLLKDATGCDLGDVSDDEIQTVCIKNNIKVDETWNYGQMLDELMSKLVEPNLIQPTFIIDYPKAISPLAKVHRNGDQNLVERYELFIGGAEFANSFSELNDPVDQRERLEAQAALKEKGDEEAQPVDEQFIQAMECGMPPTGGVGLGIDRLTMLLTENRWIKDVILFPAMRPEK